MQLFLDWNGWGFLGAVLTVVGSLFSVGFAYSASKEAKKAAAAAEEARKTVSTVDTVSEMTRALRLLKEIRMRADHQEWGHVSELSEDVRVILAAIVNTTHLSNGEDFTKHASDVAAQMATLGKNADIEHHEIEGRKPIDPVRIKSVISDQSEKIAKLLQETKEKVGQQ
ncbi:hypothetical protein [Sulfitobacter geojensis]|uniref:hypothetical protein n=1 Tax=Sulfitobacter geojensis TaxID=1342299 RepID=UPI003B8AC4E0